MSELKARRAYFSEDEYDRGTHKICAKVSDCGYDRKNDWWSYAFEDEVYLKSEADKAIAELKAQKAQAEDDCAYWKMNEKNAANAMHETEEYAMQLHNESRHQKYKRCLDKAELCRAKRNEIIARNPTLILNHPTEYLTRWENRWLELAEKFKEAK